MASAPGVGSGGLDPTTAKDDAYAAESSTRRGMKRKLREASDYDSAPWLNEELQSLQNSPQTSAESPAMSPGGSAAFLLPSEDEARKEDFSSEEDDVDDWAAELEADLFREYQESRRPLPSLPFEILCHIFRYSKPSGKVCKNWDVASVSVSREKCREVLGRALEPYFVEAKEMATAIEEALFTLTDRSINQKYNMRARHLMFNLKDPKNNYLRQRVCTGELPYTELVAMDSRAMASPELIQQRKAWMKEKLEEVKMPNRCAAGFIESKLFTCPSCSSKETMYRTWRRKSTVDRYRILVRCRRCNTGWEE